MNNLNDALKMALAPVIKDVLEKDAQVWETFENTITNTTTNTITTTITLENDMTKKSASRLARDKELPRFIESEKTPLAERERPSELKRDVEWSSFHPLIRDDVLAYGSEMGFNSPLDTYYKYESLMLVMLQWEDWQHQQLAPDVIQALARWNKYIQLKGGV